MTTVRRWLLCLASIPLCLAAQAQQTDTLRDGTLLRTDTRHDLPLVTFVLATRGGGASQVPGMAPAQLLPHLLLRPLPDVAVIDERRKLVQHLQRLGIQYQAGVEADHAWFAFTTQPRHLPGTLELLAQLLRNPLYDSLSIRKAALDVAADEQQAEAHPLYYVQQALLAALYGPQWARFQAAPSYELARRTQPADLMAYQTQVLRAPNVVLTAAGDVAAAELVQLCDSLLVPVLAASAEASIPTQPPALPAPVRDTLVLVLNERMAQPVLLVGWRLAGLAADPELLEALPLTAALLEHPEHPLQQRLALRGLGRIRSARAETYATHSRLVLEVLPQPGQTLTALQAVQSGLPLLRTPAALDGARIADARQQLAAQRIYRSEGTQASARLLAQQALRGIGHSAASDTASMERLQALAAQLGEPGAAYAVLTSSSAPELPALEAYLGGEASTEVVDSAKLATAGSGGALATVEAETPAAGDTLHTETEAATVAADAAPAVAEAEVSVEVPAAEQATDTAAVPSPDALSPAAETTEPLETDAVARAPDTLRMRYQPDAELAAYTLFYRAESTVLDSGDRAKLAELAVWLRANPDQRVAVDGHSSLPGARALNLQVSRQRAAAVRDVLVAVLGVPEVQLVVRAYGESKPLYDDAIPAGRRRNRRVEFTRIGL